jgi:hypothetical protein
VVLLKVSLAYQLFGEIIRYYAATQLVQFIQRNNFKTLADIRSALPAKLVRMEWANIGGQLIPQPAIQKLLDQIQSGKWKNWEEVHHFYRKQGEKYAEDKFHHALYILKETHGISLKKADSGTIRELLAGSILSREWMTHHIYESRAKDYANPFRQMVYEDIDEMNAVVGSLSENAFIQQEMESLAGYKKEISELLKKMKL